MAGILRIPPLSAIKPPAHIVERAILEHDQNNMLDLGVLTLIPSVWFSFLWEQMEITAKQYARIKDSLPVHSVSPSNLQLLNALLYVGRVCMQMARSAEAVRQLAHHLHAA
jgi:hypothetical protein